jgi:hypothetical protein
MRVPSRALLILAFALALVPFASDVFCAGNLPVLSGLAYIDYRDKPRFKVGDWIKYHFSSRSDDGRSEDYDMTLLISGEERFWGDDAFWLETWSEGRTLPPQKNAILMSYSAFGDTAWLQHLDVYQRKSASLLEKDVIVQELTRRVLGGRASSSDRASLTVLTDTVGTDTVNVTSGTYRCTKVVRKAGVGSVEELGDSTLRVENWSQRTLFLTPKIPITSLIRELDERWVTRKTWRVGKSGDAVRNYAMRGTGTLTLIGWGSGGLTPAVTPLNARGRMTRKPEARPVVKPRKRA